VPAAINTIAAVAREGTKPIAVLAAAVLTAAFHLAMKLESGEWKVGSLAGTPLD
jgi:hypothetical protein